MIGCLIVVQMTATALFKQVEFDVETPAAAERLAAMHAGELSSQKRGDGSSRIGFQCQGSEWIAADLTYDEVFGGRRPG